MTENIFNVENTAKPLPSPKKASNSARFNRDQARKSASEGVNRARMIEEAVIAFHDASERIEEAQGVIVENAKIRITSLQSMRECGHSVAKMSELTGMSPSTIQKLLTSRT